MGPVGRYGVHRRVVTVALWLGCGVLVAVWGLLLALVGLIRVVGGWMRGLALGTQDRIAELDLVDGPRPRVSVSRGAVVDGVVVSVRYEDKETVE
jgi:hypothetical protein